ncbi:acetyl-CoA synthetase-like protein [Infundibulicybe gibba]|nr:acetyl-CoA synthetase-like protein [Infundibulicybe gibba]
MGDSNILLPLPVLGEKDCNFKPPPLDGSITIPEIYDWHQLHNPDHPVFTYKSEIGLVRLTYSAVTPAVHRAARFIMRETIPSIRPSIAILATTDTITYFCTVLGSLRVGIPVFPISPRNSATAIARLLQETQSTHIFVSPEPALAMLSSSIIAELRGHNDPPKVAPMPVYSDLFCNKGDSRAPLEAYRNHDNHTPIIFVHSSGSSSKPKAIHWTHASLLQVALAPYLGAYDLRGEVFGAHGIAMGHASGLNYIAWVCSAGITMATFRPASPAIIPTPHAVLEGMVECRASFLICVPSFLEAWSKHLGDIDVLKGLAGVAYGGGPLDRIVGDTLVKYGVKLLTVYGSTEVGVISSLLPEFEDTDWEYFTINPHCAAQFIPRDGGVFSLVITKTPTQALYISNTIFQGSDAYATGDLLEAHPTKLGRWRIVGRADNEITLSTGEKTDPRPLEAGLAQHGYKAVVFGRGRFHNGVIVLPMEGCSIDPRDSKALLQFRDKIWPRVEEYNSAAPAHSRIFKEMILIASPKKPFPITDKQTIKRAAVLELYEPEINQLYLEGGANQSYRPPIFWSFENVLNFLHAVFSDIIPSIDSDFKDIFQYGCDRHAMRIRNAIEKALHAVPNWNGSLPADFVYQYPTIHSLAKRITVAATTLESPHGHSGLVDKTREMLATLDRFSQPFVRVPSTRMPPPRMGEDVVIVTGTTGALGTHVLAALVESENVSRVIALNRPSDTLSIHARQRAALAKRGLNPDIASSAKVLLVQCDYKGPGLGIQDVIQNELRETITHIIHTAWPVDFNLTLNSFSASLEALRALIDFSLTCRVAEAPRFIFTSSIGVFRQLDAQGVVPEGPVGNPAVAAGMGYSESKWVAEQLLILAARASNLCPIIVRVGQLTGSSRAVWNESEWFPCLVKSSIALGCLPALEGPASWIPMDIAARTLVGMRNSKDRFIHLIHPKPTPIRKFVEFLGVELHLPLRTYPEWLALLEGHTAKDNSTAATHRVPALKSISLFRDLQRLLVIGNYYSDPPLIACRHAVEACSALAHAAPLGREDVQSWLNGWRAIGFL